MILEYLSSFQADYRRLPQEIQRQVDRAILLFRENPHHPSLHIKKMKGTRNIWEGRATISYRFTFRWEGDIVRLRRVGTHDILKKETR